MEDLTTNGTSGTSGVSEETASKPRTKRAKALDDAQCKTCGKYGWDETELNTRIKELSSNHNVNQIASMLRVHSQYVKEVLNSK